MTLWAVDEAYVNSFPGLRQVVLDGWLLRFGGGYTRRANSVAPLTDRVAGDVRGRVEACAALYAAQGLPALFRIPSFHDPALDGILAAQGYTREGETLVLQAPLGPSYAADGVTLTPGTPPATWLEAQARLSGGSEAVRAARRRILDAIGVPCVFASAGLEGLPIAAMAMGAVHAGHLCLHMVVTDPAARRRGLARRVVAAAMAWARDDVGARAACLGVDATNAGAIALYRGTGFGTELYRYHYRRAPGR